MTTEAELIARIRAASEGDEQERRALTGLMAELPPTQSWLAELVTNFASTRIPELANSLAFTLAGAANDAGNAPGVAPLVIRMMTQHVSRSPWARLNLGTAVQRLVMFDALPAVLGRPVPGLGQLLRESLNEDDLVAAVAAVVFNNLRYAGLDDALSASDRDGIARAIATHVGSSNKELAAEAREVAELLQTKPA